MDALRAVWDAQIALHMALSVIMGWLVVLWARPGETFATSSSYAVRPRTGPEEAWVMAFWMVASVGVIGLSTLDRALRLVSALVLAVARGVVALSCVLSNPASFRTGTYAVLAGLGYYLAWRRTDDGI